MSVQDELVEIERQLWKNDPVLYRENYTDDALMTFPETGVIDVGFALYKAVARWAHEAAPVTSLATTVYVRRSGRWKAAHHQQSPVET